MLSRMQAQAVPTRESICESVPAQFQHGEEPARAIAEKHAQQLLCWLQIELQDCRGNSRRLLATELKSAYAEMCEEQRLLCRPWNPLAASFAKLIRQRGRPLKTYSDLIGRDGKKRRRRVYEIPPK